MRPCFRCVGLRTVVCAFRSCGGYLPSSDYRVCICVAGGPGPGRWPCVGCLQPLGGVFKNDRYTTSTTVPCAVGATHTTGLSRRLFSRLSTSRSTPPCPARGSRGACVSDCEDPTARNSAVHRPRCMCISRTAGWRRVHSPNGRDQGALSAPCNRSGPTSS